MWTIILLFEIKSLNQEIFIAMGNFPKYRGAKAFEYLIIGAGIDDIKIAKKSWILPGQSSIIFDIAPVDYTFKVQAMSADKLSFILPVVFIIGPRVDSVESLYKHAKLTTCQEKDSTHMHKLVKGVNKVETRVLAASGRDF